MVSTVSMGDSKSLGLGSNPSGPAKLQKGSLRTSFFRINTLVGGIMILNYLVSENLITIKGSGIASAISDHMKLMKEMGIRRRLVVITDVGSDIIGDFDCEVVYATHRDLKEIDGIWYAHSTLESLWLSKLKIHHLYQMHNGDLMLTDKLKELRLQLGLRSSIEIEQELTVMSLEYVTVVSQNKTISDKLLKLGVDSVVARQPFYTNKIERPKTFDLCITTGLRLGKGLPFIIGSLLKLPKDKRIAIICTVPPGSKKSIDPSDYIDSIRSMGMGCKFDRENINWFFGIDRNEVNMILASSKQCIHPSFVECNPLVVYESALYCRPIVNKHGNYTDHLPFPVTPIGFGASSNFFDSQESEFDINKFNYEGIEEWNRVLKNMRSLV